MVFHPETEGIGFYVFTFEGCERTEGRAEK
jgi:hypothetical protein